MISLINSLCITLIFTAWVWALKQEIIGLGPDAHAVSNGAVKEKGHAQAHRPGSRRHTDNVLSDQHGKQRSNGGVPTWTIA